MKRRRFLGILEKTLFSGTFFSAVGKGVTKRFIVSRITARKAGLYPGKVRVLRETDIAKPGRWAG